MDITKKQAALFIVGVLICSFVVSQMLPRNCPADPIGPITQESIGTNTITGDRSNQYGVKRIDVAMTTNGTGTAEESLRINGEILKIYVKNGTFNASTYVNVSDTITTELILNLYNITGNTLYYPMQNGTRHDGTVLINTSNTYRPFVANEILVHVSGAGNATSGNVSIWYL